MDRCKDWRALVLDFREADVRLLCNCRRRQVLLDRCYSWCHAKVAPAASALTFLQEHNRCCDFYRLISAMFFRMWLKRKSWKRIKDIDYGDFVCLWRRNPQPGTCPYMKQCAVGLQGPAAPEPLVRNCGGQQLARLEWEYMRLFISCI